MRRQDAGTDPLSIALSEHGKKVVSKVKICIRKIHRENIFFIDFLYLFSDDFEWLEKSSMWWYFDSDFIHIGTRYNEVYE